ncbi:MAG: DinB family protein [Bacteroidota bacterium]|nr:DinB family protein [Bacteroidota bacterium]
MEFYKSLRHRLEDQHLALPEKIKNISPERMLSRPAENKWNIHENIAHLAKYQITFADRLQFILKNPNSLMER